MSRYLSFGACALALLACVPLHAQEDKAVYYGTFYKPVCDLRVPGFEKATATNYAAWRAQHGKAIAALEADAKFLKDREQALTPPPADIAAAKIRELTGTCERVAGIFEIAAPAEERFAAPERTWEAFRDALRSANRETVYACLAGEARKTFLVQMRAMDDEQMKRLGNSIAEIRLAQPHGSFQEAVILHANGTAGSVVFVKSGGNWKIGRM
jgi:hypothetical protein